jgi:hypothetical protein
MGGAFMGVARGQESLFVNPANLGLADGPGWSLALPQLVASGSVSGPALPDLRDLARFDGLSDARRDEIFAAIPGNGVEADLELRLPALLVQKGGWAAGVTYGALGQHTFARDLVGLMLFGYETGRADYSVEGTEGSYAAFWDVAVGYGRAVGDISLGMTARYVRGSELSSSRLLDPAYSLASQDIDVRYVGVAARGGNGYGLDVGMAWQPLASLTVGASIANLIAGMNWSSDVRVRELRLDRVDIETASASVLLDGYRDSERPASALDDPAVKQLAGTMLDEAYFPTEARFGAAWRPGTGTALAASFRTGLTDGRLAGPWERSLAAGVEQRLWFLSVRAGAASNLSGAKLLSGGVSLGPIDLGVARMTEPLTGRGDREGVMGTAGIRIGRY